MMNGHRTTMLQAAVRQRVGGFFTNTFRANGVTCLVCTGPARADVCPRCTLHRAAFGDQLASAIFTLTYVQGNHPHELHQSAYTLRSYKDPAPVAVSQQNVQLVVAAASAVHGTCMQQQVGRPWDSLTFVPSLSRPGLSHPVAELVHQVRQFRDSSRRFGLQLGPGSSDTSRTVRADRFVVPEEHRDRVSGSHILLLDDTWTTGSRMQSAAVALRQAGAAAVSGLCVARWCRWDWSDHAALLDELDVLYDPLTCPAAEALCDRGAATGRSGDVDTYVAP